MTKKLPEATNEALLSELTSIKRLLMLALIKSGASQSELALALRKDQSEVSRAMPSKKIKPFN